MQWIVDDVKRISRLHSWANNDNNNNSYFIDDIYEWLSLTGNTYMQVREQGIYMHLISTYLNCWTHIIYTFIFVFC